MYYLDLMYTVIVRYSNVRGPGRVDGNERQMFHYERKIVVMKRERQNLSFKVS